MDVKKVFVNTYRYDFHLAKICIASVRYWYPEISIYLIKDEKEGKFDTSFTEKLWNVKVLELTRNKFGWGYGKLEVLFLENKESFLVIDADTVLTGPVIDQVKGLKVDFVVDKEVQPSERFKEIYYNAERINELDKDFVYPGYSFNTGQWFGTSSIIRREDFNKSLIWSQPPVTRNRDIVVNNDQGHLNYILHSFDQRKIISISRIKLMIWPVDGNADFIDLKAIQSRSCTYPYVIHWAGMSAARFSSLPRKDILQFYREFYYSRTKYHRFVIDEIKVWNLKIDRKLKHFLKAMNF